jgi:hypothetical protein
MTMHMTNVGTIGAHPRGYTWSPGEPLDWGGLIAAIQGHVRLAVHAEMSKRGDGAPTSILLEAPQVTRLDNGRYFAKMGVILNPTKSECAEPGALLVRFDGPTRNLDVARMLEAVGEKLGKTKPLTQPGPIALT